MPIMEWSAAYSVGVKQIDAEHVKLVNMINEAYDAIDAEGDDDVAVALLVADMVEYARIHFDTEARLMNEYGYPGADEHMQEHGDFTARAVTSGGTLSQEWSLDPVHLFQFLADWLNHHILESDKELAKFLNEKGVE